MSFRLRLLLILIISPLVALLVFMFLLTKEFEQDKIAYIFELQDETLKRVESQINQIFLSEKEWVPVYKYGSNQWAQLTPDIKLLKAVNRILKDANILCRPNETYKHLIEGTTRWVARCQVSTNNEYVFSVMPWSKLADIFRVTSFQDFYLIHLSGNILYSSTESYVGQNAFKTFVGSEDLIREGKRMGRFKTTVNNEPMIGTENVLKNSPLFLMSMTPQDAARRAAYPFIVKGFLTALVIILLIFVVGHFLSHNISRKIKTVLEAFEAYGAGQESLRLPVITKSKDEFQQLNVGFNQMADQIHELLNEKKVAAASEHEMKLAGDVQKMFFPKDNNLFGTTEVQGFVWPASQCGGDWWHVFESGDKLIVILGDVTGHGFTSALMTSAGRAVVANIEYDYQSLEVLASQINKSLYGISKGTFQMTFCGIELDRSKNIIHILNCSHEPPIIHSSAGSSFVSNIHGARLGEKPSSEYQGENLPLADIQMITIYSDGLREIVNEKGKIWGEKRLVNSLTKALPLPAIKRLKTLQANVSAFRGAALLNDDVSLVTVKFKN